jgi:peptidyl-prolyl cis-trans isomerase B (cyclophilin B)
MMSRWSVRASAFLLLASSLLMAHAIQRVAAQGTKPAPPKPTAPDTATAPAAATGPQLVVDTAKGTFVIQLFEKEAPKSVGQVVTLAKQGFYTNQKVHRVVQGQVVQFGDKQTRDATLREWWGRGPGSGSGKPIGMAEISKTRKHKAGTVAMAHAGDPRAADSQIYIALRPMPQLDGKHTIIGEVTSGLAIVSKLAMGDVIKKVTVQAAPAPAT